MSADIDLGEMMESSVPLGSLLVYVKSHDGSSEFGGQMLAQASIAERLAELGLFTIEHRFHMVLHCGAPASAYKCLIELTELGRATTKLAEVWVALVESDE